MKPLTISYFTCRKEPLIELFLRSLKRELKGDLGQIRLHIVDFYADDKERREWLLQKLKDEGMESINLAHTTPMPCEWQGKYKKTKNEHFAASNSRNTAFALCPHDFIICIDDLTVVMPGWLDQARHAQEHGYVALGAYKKVLNLACDKDGNVTYEPHPPGVDSRWPRGSPNGIVKAEGSWLFGCSFALPIHFALKVNGFENGCNGLGMEDFEFGIRMQRAGAKFFYNLNFLTLEDELAHGAAGNQKFIREARMTPSGVMADWVMYNKVSQTPKIWTEYNDFNLKELRDHVLKGLDFPIPTRTKDWASGELPENL